MRELLLTELVDKLTHEMAVLERLKFAATSDKTKAQPKREALPANLPRVEVHHEPDGTVCATAAVRMNGHDPYAYPEDLLEPLSSQSASRVDGSLPHRWKPAVVGG